MSPGDVLRRALAAAWLALVLGPLALLGALSGARGWVFPDLLPARWTGDFWAVATGPEYRLLESLGLSLALSGTVAALGTLVGFGFSAALARARHGGFWTALGHLPFAVSPVVFGVALLGLFLRLDWAGTAHGLAAAQLLLAAPYAALLLQAFWNPRQRALAEAARTLGAGPTAALRHVSLPLAAPLLGLCALQLFLWSWFDYALALIVGRGLVGTMAARAAELLLSGHLQLAAVAALLLLGPAVAAVALLQLAARAAAGLQS